MSRLPHTLRAKRGVVFGFVRRELRARPRRALRYLLIFWLCLSPAAHAQFQYRPSQEYRSLNTDQYQISIQKSGRADVALSSGQQVFHNAFPMVRFAGDTEPKALKVDGRWSERYDVDDALGVGNGMLLRYKDCEWSIRAYPSKPFLAVQVAYVNTTKKPVFIAELLPWCIGDPRKGSLSLASGTKQATVLVNAFGGGEIELLQDRAQSDTQLAVYNLVNGRSLIAGFLTQTVAFNSLALSTSRKKGQDIFDTFRASCTFDPPVVVPPGERFNSEVLYLAVSESDPLQGLARYARAVAVANGIKSNERVIPHGWSVSGDFLNEESIVSELDVMAAKYKRYGWSHVALGKGWQRSRGDWQPNPDRFPRGMKWLVDEIHSRGLTAGIWIDPFVVESDSATARGRPGWLLRPQTQAKGGDLRVLDVTAPGASDYLRQLGLQIREWGFDAVEGIGTRKILEASGHRETSRTRVEIARATLASFFDGFGLDRFASTPTPSLVSSPYFDGAEMSASVAAERSYLSPHLWAPVIDAVSIAGPGISSSPRAAAALTKSAILGGPVRLYDAPSSLSPVHGELLRRALSDAWHPVRALDLFYNDDPRIWVVPFESRTGNWQVVAVFNDGDSETTTTLPFSALRLRGDEYYAVYDFWEERYYGTARTSLDVSVPPGEVRVLCLRPYRERPMFLSIDSDLTQGRTVSRVRWNRSERKLSGTFQAIENTPCTLRFLVPEAYETGEVTTSIGNVRSEQEGRVLKVEFQCPKTEVVSWDISF